MLITNSTFKTRILHTPKHNRHAILRQISTRDSSRQIPHFWFTVRNTPRGFGESHNRGRLWGGFRMLNDFARCNTPLSDARHSMDLGINLTLYTRSDNGDVDAIVHIYTHVARTTYTHSRITWWRWWPFQCLSNHRGSLSNFTHQQAGAIAGVNSYTCISKNVLYKCWK